MSTAFKQELSEKLENAIYKNYRATLRSNRSTQMRAPEARQNALKVTADRYHTPVSVVKNIVRRFDEATGVKHEYPEKFLKEVEIRKAVELASEEWEGQLEACQSCGVTNLLDDRVNDPSVIVMSLTSSPP